MLSSTGGLLGGMAAPRANAKLELSRPEAVRAGAAFSWASVDEGGPSLEFLGLNFGRRADLKSDLDAEGGGPTGVVEGMGSSGRLSGVEGGSEGSEGTANDMLMARGCAGNAERKSQRRGDDESRLDVRWINNRSEQATQISISVKMRSWTRRETLALNRFSRGVSSTT